MIESNMSYDPALIRELRKLALDGAKPVDLIRHIQEREEYAPDYIVPVFAYLRHAFGAPLRVILPLREEMGVGRESNGLSVVFWFAAAMLEHAELGQPNRDAYERMNRFDKETLSGWRTDESSQLECVRLADGVYARGKLTIMVHGDEPADADIRRRINDFADQHQRMLSQDNDGAEENNEPPRMIMDFEVHRVGSRHRVDCKVRSLKGSCIKTQRPIIASI